MRYLIAALGGLLALFVFVWIHNQSLPRYRAAAEPVVSPHKCEPVVCVRM